ncbi:S-methyl-5-thioribose-1-phosphate isomerase [Candidatus Aminicenantes bacterium AC-708-M15]|jgi:methylthioribose-1-phosphate isomerase|nr:S-methyl-5-thioribose-1-phosphate isomerase [SCandidatus Aminicenantes bacterium Aminicenantia_JdfR_composite]MCP2597482.1 S-methyl-5-thioribose-1-phosphate isomerase [Candidatus Aminicenantes bacterium AC-335-G13]MCP2598453.1 S-methyl-5-thioribose-1-phosphate isomerase [Candidatus Aminicenantes bacterium AC-335-L06]MCP2604165.1 S-methyl-5-thioribose-1-phosphate isomerase [Candidatus Aminicenantes bacterium AC-708-M15]MCP2618574.1 S-methyl-5-thioribose-1-phosphate isomerase [Candidatus Amini
MLPTIKWENNKVIMIDQRKLPFKEIYLELNSYHEVAEAISNMTIRGAPAIGIAAAFGIALGVLKLNDGENYIEKFYDICEVFKKTRPTAKNLFWAIDRIKRVFESNKNLPLKVIKEKIIEEALLIEKEDIEINKKISENGERLIKKEEKILTHCNAGELATGGFGTAIGVIKSAFYNGKKIKVYVDETRPFLQGARLTCWELKKAGIPHVLITDNMAGWLMKKGKITCVIVGADRIASNGDTANKIGTYSLAILAKEHGIPFYVAAPLSTIDFSIGTGEEIPIEERNKKEVLEINSISIAPEGTEAENPAFDVTPSSFITAIITEKGVVRKPYLKSLKKLKEVS